MTLPIFIASGVAGVPNIGLLSQLPNADAAVYRLMYFATDTGQLFECIQSGQAPDTFAWAQLQITTPAVLNVNSAAVNTFSNPGNSFSQIVQVHQQTIAGNQLIDVRFTGQTTGATNVSFQVIDTNSSTVVFAIGPFSIGATTNECYSWQFAAALGGPSLQWSFQGFAAAGTLSAINASITAWDLLNAP